MKALRSCCCGFSLIFSFLVELENSALRVCRGFVVTERPVSTTFHVVSVGFVVALLGSSSIRLVSLSKEANRSFEVRFQWRCLIE